MGVRDTPEEGLLGLLLSNPEIWREVEAEITSEDFVSSKHKELWEIMQKNSSGEVVDLMWVGANYFEHQSFNYWCSLPESNFALPSSLPSLIRSIKTKSLKRRVNQLGSAIQLMFEESQPVEDVIAHIEKELVELQTGRRSRNDEWVAIRNIVDTIPEELQKRKHNYDNEISTGIMTGVKSVDDRLSGGIQPEDLVILAARPAMGKTAMALNLSISAARQGYGVGIISLEMSKEKLVARQLASEARVDSKGIKQGTFSRGEYSKMMEALPILGEYPIWIRDLWNSTINDIVSAARRLKQKVPTLGMIVIDYLQLMDLKNAHSREQAVAQASRRLKLLAKELGIAIILLAQLNRKVEDRPTKMPQMSDLRESGAIEQDADMIIFLMRPCVYFDNKPEGLAHFIIGKYREGETTTVDIAWNGPHQLFSDLESRYDEYQ